MSLNDAPPSAVLLLRPHWLFPLRPLRPGFRRPSGGRAPAARRSIPASVDSARWLDRLSTSEVSAWSRPYRTGAGTQKPEKPAHAPDAGASRAANWGPSGMDPFPRVISMQCEVKLKGWEKSRAHIGTGFLDGTRTPRNGVTQNGFHKKRPEKIWVPLRRRG